MSNHNELTERDWELLEKIDEFLANGGGEVRETDSLYGFCAHLAGTVPRADDAFREQLEARLIAKLNEQQEEVKAVNAAKGEQDWVARLFPSRPRWRTVFTGAVIAVIFASTLLAISPGFLRTAAAQAVGEIRQLLGSGTATGTVSETELLRVTEGLVTTQTPDSVVEDTAGGATPAGRPRVLRDLSYCNAPDVRPPGTFRWGAEGRLMVFAADSLLVGEAPGQRFKGAVVIELLDPETSPNPELVWYGGVVENMRGEVLEPALAALWDPAIPMQRLPYLSLRVRVAYDSEPPCLVPAHPDEQGYVVIEVGDDQVNIGYDGAGTELRERAVRALEQELQKGH